MSTIRTSQDRHTVELLIADLYETVAVLRSRGIDEIPLHDRVMHIDQALLMTEQTVPEDAPSMRLMAAVCIAAMLEPEATTR